jgi:hypothetical protein
MLLKKQHLVNRTVLLCLVLFSFMLLQQSCKKTEIGVIENTVDNTAKTEQFFKLPANANSALQKVVNELKKQNSNNGFITEFITKEGFAIWDKATILVKPDDVAAVPNSGTPLSPTSLSGLKDTTIFIPLVLDNANYVNAFIKAKVTDTVSMRLFRQGDYSIFPFQTTTPTAITTAENYAIRFMQMDKDVFGYTAFEIKDKRLFNNSKNYADTAKIKRVVDFANGNSKSVTANGVAINSAFYFTCVTITTTTTTNHCPYGVGNCTGPNGTCDNCPSVCANVSSSSITACDTYSGYEEGGSSGGWPVMPSGGGGGGGNPSPCSNSGIIITNRAVLPNCTPVPNPWPPATDANGYLYARIAELKDKLAANPFALEPCDSLNIMPLDPVNGYGTMYQRVAQFTPSQYVKDRIDSIKNVASTWMVDNFYTTNVNSASGDVVNCDFFPVRITQLPTGFTPETLLEYFRKNINKFVDSNLDVSFEAYDDNPNAATHFYDTARLNAFGINSIGALIHIHMTNDGSVIESDYYNNNTPGSEKHRFTFTTMATPLDFSHPVAGNREFGIYRSTDPLHPNEFVFYTMGVDRTSDWVFDLGNSMLNGFAKADKLWSSVQKNMINFINKPSSGGLAQYHGPPASVKARPKWDDVKDYLKGLITWETLKQRLGC